MNLIPLVFYVFFYLSSKKIYSHYYALQRKGAMKKDNKVINVKKANVPQNPYPKQCANFNIIFYSLVQFTEQNFGLHVHYYWRVLFSLIVCIASLKIDNACVYLQEFLFCTPSESHFCLKTFFITLANTNIADCL